MTKRVLIGKFPDGGYGLRISKSGYDVSSNPIDNERLVFNSDWSGILPIHMSGSLSVSAGGTATGTHGLSYYPFSSALIKIGSRDWEFYSGMNICYPFRRKESRNYRQQNGQIATAEQTFYPNPREVYTYAGDRTTLAQFKVTTSDFSFYCSEAAQLYYIIYRMKAF